MPRMGTPTVVLVPAANAVCRGLFWLGVVVMASPLSVAMSYAQPEPKTLLAAVVSCALKLSKSPKPLLMAP